MMRLQFGLRTLISLVLVMGVLVGVEVRSYLKRQQQLKIEATKNLLKRVESQLNIYLMSWGTHPDIAIPLREATPLNVAF
jgi:uncharacterized membrane protein YciS (DUF1049 family)